MADSTIEGLLKKIHPIDIHLLQVIKERGPQYADKIKDELGPKWREVLTRCKARSLITPVRKSAHYYTYDISDLALDLLKQVEIQEHQAQTAQKP